MLLFIILILVQYFVRHLLFLLYRGGGKADALLHLGWWATYWLKFFDSTLLGWRPLILFSLLSSTVTYVIDVP